ncbi:MAG: Gfo/Idh/MocA family oxidoreductase, partial [Thermoleophilaceae bacterium]
MTGAPASRLRASDRAPGLLLGAGVELPDGVELGGHVVIHPGTDVGDGARIQDGAVLGKPVVLGPRSRASAATVASLRIAPGATIGAGDSGDRDEGRADPEGDAVVVGTHVPTHADLTLRVLAAGKHCFVEKPLAQS